MLQLNEHFPTTVEFDPYIPIKITFGSWDVSLEGTGYWITGDSEQQYIEIGAAEERGVIRSITLVLIKEINLEIKTFPDVRLVPGIPIFKALKYDKNFLVKEDGPIEMFVGKDKLQIFFSRNTVFLGLISDRAVCFFDEDHLFCGFEVSDITHHERQILEENFINRK